jgi:bacterioferritin
VKPASPDIIKKLNEVLTLELTAINQYFLHAEMCGDWGFAKLYKVIRAESIDEMKHAEKLIERILFLDGLPNVQRLGKITIGETVKEQFELDLALEERAIPILNAGIQLCRDEADNGTRSLFEGILVDEERHVDWLESQLELMRQIGVENYLAQQVEQGPV